MTVGRDRAASVAQYVLLGGFAAVASGISSQGLTGFARSNMDLSGPWPYLLFLALDGAAGVCAVLLVRRATHGGRSLAPRLAVWGLVAASAAFNYTHAPGRPDAPEAYALMPAIAAVLFEFCLQESRSRASVHRSRSLGALRWLHFKEGIRIRLRMAADQALSANDATRHVRVESAALSLYRLREAIARRGSDRDGAPSGARRVRRAHRRAQAALARAGFADASIAADVLRHVQMLTMTATLASLDYTTPDEAHAAIGSMITSEGLPSSGTSGEADDLPIEAPHGIHIDDPGAEEDDGLSLASESDSAGADDARLVDAARRIAADAALDGVRLSQTALADRLRQEGWKIANNRLSWLAATIRLGSRHA
ncbi:DUF2637 domain-containing protein [Trebonia kvetii]|uniref:DUF2637 domain-containing protein n=1 Tax=Trebonia kvetii TaxID=2480626 RepID=A0A6P2BT29_9ACTN|nr:DUF2637 domain-containing protein [Trebonia kvetii]TVZ02110.1 DUF2637 domain-containing protein [Trebonia kvetii]